MATYSSNTTIKIGSTISQKNSNGTPFTYTVPSDSYLSVSNVSIISYTVTIDFPSPHVTSESYTTTTTFTPARHFPAGTVISCSNGGIGLGEFSGMLFTNTP